MTIFYSKKIIKYNFLNLILANQPNLRFPTKFYKMVKNHQKKSAFVTEITNTSDSKLFNFLCLRNDPLVISFEHP